MSQITSQYKEQSMQGFKTGHYVLDAILVAIVAFMNKIYVALFITSGLGDSISEFFHSQKNFFADSREFIVWLTAILLLLKLLIELVFIGKKRDKDKEK